MDGIRIRQISTEDAEYQDLLHFRNKILRVPLGQNLFDEDLSDDKEDYMLITVEGNTIVGCVMLHPLAKGTLKLRQMAVAEHLQGKGVGRELVAYAERLAVQAGYRRITLHARRTAEGFYEGLGYNQTGEPFEEVGIPHIAMEKDFSEAL